MAEACIHRCTLCLAEDISVVACEWCPECEDFLCNSCSKHHKKSKLSKQHMAISIADYEELPPFISTVTTKCSDHEDKYTLFCSFHSAPCCLKCLNESHRECRDILPLNDVLEKIKSSAAFTNLERDLQNLASSLDEVIEFLDKKCSENFNVKTDMLQEIHRIRETLNEHIDQIEKRLLEKLVAEKKVNIDSLKKLKCKVIEKQKQIDDMEKDLTKMSKFATNLQTYIGLNIVEKRINEEMNFISDLKSCSDIIENDVKFEMSPSLRVLVDNSSAFGTITAVPVPIGICIGLDRDKVAQHSSPAVKGNNLESDENTKKPNSATNPETKDATVSTKPKTISNMQLLEKTSIYHKTSHKRHICGCAILPDKRLLFVDHETKSLMLHDQYGRYERDVLTFEGSPFDIVHVRGDIVAVTIMDRHKVSFIDVEKCQEIQTIRLNGTCTGIDRTADRLIVRVNTEDLFVFLDFKGNIQCKIRIPGKFLSYFSVLDEKIYCTNWNKNKVYCYDLKGRLLWTFNPDLILHPCGIAVDSAGFTYVACMKINSVLVLGPDGKESKILLTAHDGLELPGALAIDELNSRLLVCNQKNGLSARYKISGSE